jgi:hypothetical protein
MNAKRTLPSPVDPFISCDFPLLPHELSEQESDDAFKIVVTLREAIEAADSVERRIEGTNDGRYASFLSKARDRHLQTAETARNLLVEMIVDTGEMRTKHGAQPTARRSS